MRVQSLYQKEVQGSAMCSHIFQRTQVATYAEGPQLYGLHAESEAKATYFAQKSLVTLLRPTTEVLIEEGESRNHHRYAVIVQDLATQWIQRYPCKSKASQEMMRSLQKLLDSKVSPKVIHTDNSLEFGKTCEDLQWNHCTSTPHQSETNGIEERAVRRVKESTSAILLQSGAHEQWLADSTECDCCLRNVQDL